MEEIWKDIYYVDNRNNEIIDYRGLYQVSNFGNVKNIKTNKLLKQRKDKDGYLDVSLNKKRFRIHRLVAYIFIENNDKTKNIVNHKDENVSNNNSNNLEWCDIKYNCNYGTRNQRISECVVGINIKTNEIIKFYGMREAERNGFNHGNISEYCNGKRKSHKGYKWYYLDDYLNMATLSEADLEINGTCND